MKKVEKPLIDLKSAIRNPIKRSLFGLIRPSLEKLMGIDRLNELHEQVAGGGSPPEVAAEVLALLDIQYEIREDELAPLREHKGPLVFLSNHPFGGIEALFIVIILSKVRSDYRIMANFLLGQVEEMRETLILVDPFENKDSQQRNSAPMKEALGYLRQGGLLGIFPSGEVAALKLSSGKITEPEWNPNVAKLIQKTNAAVVPIYFHGHNSMLFHMAGTLNPKLRTSLLIREFTRPRTRELSYQIGDLIPSDKIAQYKDPESLAHFLKSKLFLLRMRYTSRRMGIRRRKRNYRLLKPRKHQVREVIPPLSPDVLREEIAAIRAEEGLLLSQQAYDVLLFRAEQAPHLLRELGRQRELTFREAGEGTGHELDLSDYDTWYEHLLIWDRDAEQIAGAYRLGRVDQILGEIGKKGLYVTTSFRLQPELFQSIRPAVELSRAFVATAYQRSFHPLMLLWSGIGHYLVRHPRYRYLIGSLSVSNEFHPASQNFLVKYLRDHYFNEYYAAYAHPRHPFPLSQKVIREHYDYYKVNSLNDLQDMISQVEKVDRKVPVLLRQYLKLETEVLGFNVDPDFANVLDVLILTDIPASDATQIQKYMGKENHAYYMSHYPSLQQTSAETSSDA